MRRWKNCKTLCCSNSLKYLKKCREREKIGPYALAFMRRELLYN